MINYFLEEEVLVFIGLLKSICRPTSVYLSYKLNNISPVNYNKKSISFNQLALKQTGINYSPQMSETWIIKCTGLKEGRGKAIFHWQEKILRKDRKGQI